MELPTENGKLKLNRYVSRIEYLRQICRGKRVLHLGCSSGRYVEDRLDRGSLLHAILHEEAKELYGIDLNPESLVLMRDQLGFQNVYEGNAERLDEWNVDELFDVVLAGDLLEHLTCPGAMCKGVRRFLRDGGQFVVSTNNAFGLHYQLRRWTGSYTEHVEHVCFFSPETLVHLLERHGYRVQEMHGGYTEPPHSWKQKIMFAIGSPLFKLMPVLAGTLIVVATPVYN